ncbi:MAG: inositol monophosphatase family protein [Nocardioidaceae bacterium]
MITPPELLGLAESVVSEAGSLVAAGRRGEVEVSDTKSSPTDVVTAVDVAAEQLNRNRILTDRPGDGFLGEETGEVTGSSGVRWVVDPIDGTVNYLYEIAQFAVSLAVEVDGAAVAGVVHNPMSVETFTALRGEGAWLNGAAIRCSKRDDVAQALVGTGYGYRADVRTHQAAEISRLVSQVRDIRRFGAATLDLCFVACGRLDAHVERGLKPWDLAAAGLIAAEAGARVEGLHGAPAGELLVIAAPDSLFDALHGQLVASGYVDWPLTDWPAAMSP